MSVEGVRSGLVCEQVLRFEFRAVFARCRPDTGCFEQGNLTWGVGQESGTRVLNGQRHHAACSSPVEEMRRRKAVLGFRP
jgi:hypothetical protein